jgi:putative DNA primase/helicase
MSRGDQPQQQGPLVDWEAHAVPGKYRLDCPVCGEGSRDKTMGLTRRECNFGVAHCFRCEYVETNRSKYITPFRRPVATAQTPPGLNPWAQNLWSQCQPLSGVAKEYLHSRACLIPPTDGHLRWHPEVKHVPTGHVGPALVALVTNVLTGQKLSLHRTWITPKGKVEGLGSRVRMLLAGHSTAQGVIRLWPDECVTSKLGIGEGIETCLSLQGIPTWCSLDAGHLAAFPVIDRVQELFIARDRDVSGERAAETCARRWSAANRRVWISAQSDGDLNDLARSTGV